MWYLTIAHLCKSCELYNMDKTDISRKTHNIAVDDCNYQALRNMGKTGDSFNSVVTWLIKNAVEGASTVSSHRERHPLSASTEVSSPHWAGGTDTSDD